LNCLRNGLHNVSSRIHIFRALFRINRPVSGDLGNNSTRSWGVRYFLRNRSLYERIFNCKSIISGLIKVFKSFEILGYLFKHTGQIMAELLSMYGNYVVVKHETQKQETALTEFCEANGLKIIE